MDPIKVTFRFLNGSKYSEFQFFSIINQRSCLDVMALFMGKRQITLQISDPTQMLPLVTEEAINFLAQNNRGDRTRINQS